MMEGLLMGHYPLTRIIHGGIIVSVLGVLFLPLPVQAQNLKDLQSQLKQAESDAAKYRELQEKEAAAADTYAEQLKKTQSQLQTVQAAITQTLSKIGERERDINAISKDIQATQARLVLLKDEQNEAIVHLYELSATSTLEILGGDSSLADYVTKYEFIASLQEHIQGIVKELSSVQTALNDKKRLLESQRQELALLKGEQIEQSVALASDKQKKDNLLAKAQQKADTYAELAEQAEAKKEQFNRELTKLLQSGGPVIRKGMVKKGEVVGYMGSTGFCYSGSVANTRECAHTHFEVFRNGTRINPRDVVPSQLSWPFDSFFVSQEYGQNWKLPSGKWAYSSGHSGIDLIANQGYGAAVKAAADGQIIEPFPQYNGYMADGYGYYRVIDHRNGYITLYGHLTQ